MISYERLLKEFWAAHRPVRPSFSRQYASIIFPRTDLERRLAQNSAAWAAAIYSAPPVTEITTWQGFTLAEDYHQKYYLQSTAEFTASTAAARINGWLGGHGGLDVLRASLDKLGLSDRGGRLLVSLAKRAGVPACQA